MSGLPSGRDFYPALRTVSDQSVARKAMPAMPLPWMPPAVPNQSDDDQTHRQYLD
jgi:hypothetical protein